MMANSAPGIEAPASLRERIFHLIEVEGHDRGVGRVVNLSLLGLIIANVLAVILETVHTASTPSSCRIARYSHVLNTLVCRAAPASVD